MPAWPGDHACPPVRAIHTRAVGRDTRVRVHLTIQLGDQDKGEPRAQGRRAARSFPDAPQAVELIPDALRPRANLVGRCGMYTLGRCACGINQWRVMGMPAMRGTSLPRLFSQVAKSTVPGYGVSMTNCANANPARSAT